MDKAVEAETRASEAEIRVKDMKVRLVKCELSEPHCLPGALHYIGAFDLIGYTKEVSKIRHYTEPTCMLFNKVRE